ncbi:uncharacterized protein LOC110990553, partial [Acanthaster planci]|uniref:Uncharacterized protein LOC110990553 n=1 Tax=Acanthaster planci TaxID=133434 RepID=A0A8B8A5Q9_ACAPL
RFTPDPVYNEGQGVEIWIVDTGIRPTHSDFGNRASIVFDAYGGNGTDCNGHGTHCAGIAAGSYFGVAKKATIRSVKVLGRTPCGSSGPYSKIVNGLDHVIEAARHPAVVSSSIARGKNTFYDQAVKNIVSAGIPVVVAAGNLNADACNTSPAWLSQVITVGATNSRDERWFVSNYGKCVDIFAPGRAIVSAGWKTDTSITTMSGTSTACAHVAGIVALYLAQNRTLSPAEIKSKLKTSATTHLLSNVGQGSPNRLAYIDP